MLTSAAQTITAAHRDLQSFVQFRCILLLPLSKWCSAAWLIIAAVTETNVSVLPDISGILTMIISGRHCWLKGLKPATCELQVCCPATSATASHSENNNNNNKIIVKCLKLSQWDLVLVPADFSPLQLRAFARLFFETIHQTNSHSQLFKILLAFIRWFFTP